MPPPMNPLQLHTAGATVRHESPFSALEVPVSEEPLPAEMRDRWVRPLYFGLQREGVDAFLAANLADADDALIDRLLAQFDWRSRTVGAFLAALRGRAHFVDRIGRLLVRSDVCYAGSAYCAALAAFNDLTGTNYLTQYLSYYLNRPELWFDQANAMAAVGYLDGLNGTDRMAQFVPQWNAFIEDKPNWNLEQSMTAFNDTMHLIRSLQRPAEGVQ
jgi:hypothetical protein